MLAGQRTKTCYVIQDIFALDLSTQYSGLSSFETISLHKLIYNWILIHCSQVCRNLANSVLNDPGHTFKILIL